MSKFVTDGDKEKVFKVIKPGKKKIKEKPTAMQKAASDNYKK